MDKEELKKLKALVKESLGEMSIDNEIDFEDSVDDYEDVGDEVPMSAIDMPIKDKGIFSAMSAGENPEDFADLNSEPTNQDYYEGGYEDDVPVSPGYFNEEELAEMIREGVERLHRKSLIETRLKQINDELNALNNPEAWDNARTEAKEQLKKKHVAWQEITTSGKLMSENKPSKPKVKKEKNPTNESVSEIMSRAAELMAEAKARYENVSKKA